MSLLMDALKKAEQAKRSVLDSAGASALPAAAVPTPPAMTLELTPYKTTPTLVATPVSAAPATPAAPPLPDEALSLPPLRATDTPYRSVSVNSPAPPRLSPKLVRPLLATLVVILLLGSTGIWYYSSMSNYLQQQATISVPQPAPQAPLPEAPIEVAPVVTSTAPSPPSVKKAAVAKPTTAPVPLVDATAVAPASPAPSIAVPVPAEPMNISRDAGQNEIFALLQQGYRAYQTGDDARAQALYARVLAVEEHNRDALLGLAALSVRQKDYAKAQEIYSQLLTLDPRDSVAQAGFVGVTGSLDPLQQEARVRSLLEQEPNAPHLLFTYATFLMQQQRWAEASRALLSAHQGQRDNPDYAFNIAVTFDHQGQKDTALKYYALALEMVGTQHTSFRVEDVRRRMQSLQSPGAAP